MFSAFAWTVAVRYLRARRQEGFVSVIAGFSFLGIALGVAALIIVLAVMNGFRHELMSLVLGANGDLLVYDPRGRLEQYDALAARLNDLEPVAEVVPVIRGQVMVTANGVAAGAIVHGMRRADLARRPLVAANIRGGTLDDFGGARSVVLGSRLADKIGVTAGEVVTLVSQQTTPTAFGAMPRQKRYRVSATFEIGMFEFDDTFVFMPLEEARLFFRLPGAATGLEVALGERSDVDSARREIAAVLDPGLRIFDWREAYGPFFDTVRAQRNVLLLVLSLIILVAAFNIVSGLNMLVRDKRAEIGILRTMGATRGMIMWIFLINSAAVGFAGTAAGVALAVVISDQLETIRRWLEDLLGIDLFSPELYFLAELPARIQVADVAWIAAMALGASLLATVYPAWRAASLDPVEALRYG